MLKILNINSLTVGQVITSTW